MSKKKPKTDDVVTIELHEDDYEPLTPEATAIVEERLQEVADGKVITTEELKERLFPNPTTPVSVKQKELLPSHWAREDGVDPHLFLWWDNREGVVTKERYREIKTRV